MEKIKWVASTFFGLVATFSKQYGILLLFVGAAVALDLITGLIKAKESNDDVWSSEKCRHGLMKKLVLFVAMFFGFYLDWVIPYMLTYINVTIPFALPFSMIICFYIALNESISICENLYAVNPEIMPKWIVNLLSNVKEKLESDTDSAGKEEI